MIIVEGVFMAKLVVVSGPSKDVVDEALLGAFREAQLPGWGLVMGGEDFETKAYDDESLDGSFVCLNSSRSATEDERDVFLRLFALSKDYLVAQRLEDGYRIAEMDLEPLVSLYVCEGITVITGIVAETAEEACSTLIWYGADGLRKAMIADPALEGVSFLFEGVDLKPKLLKLLAG